MALSDLQKMVAGMFYPAQPAANASIYDLARADAQRQAMSGLGAGLLAAAVPQTPLMRAQALQQAFGSMGNMGTNVYNAAQARLMAQQAESAANRDRLISQRASAILGGLPTAMGTPITAPVIPTVETGVSVAPSQGPLQINPQVAAITAPQPPSTAPLQFTQADQIRLQNAAALGDEEVIKVYNDIVEEKTKPQSGARPQSDIAKLNADLAAGLITPEAHASALRTASMSPTEKAYYEKVGATQFDFEQSAAQAPQKLARVEALDTLLEQAKTGKAAVPRNWVTNFASMFGLTDEQLAELGLEKGAAIAGEAATALINKQVMGNIGGPGGIPAQNFSNADLQFAMRSEASISNLPEANKFIVAMERGKIQAQIDSAKAWREYKKKYGSNADFMEWQTDYQLSLDESGKSYFDEARKIFEEATAKQETQNTQGTQSAQGAQYTEGMRAYNSQGEGVIFTNGEWVPFTRNRR